MDSVQNLSDAALYIYARSRETNDSAAPSNVTITIQSTLFADNERGLTLGGDLGPTYITGCVFSDNVAMHAGAGLLVLSNPNSPSVQVTRCTFSRNKAGRFRPSKTVLYEEQFRVNGDEVSCVVFDDKPL